MLEKIKKSLRISISQLDDEVQDLIDAAILDLSISGVINFTDDDPIILRAIIIYCKANFGLDNADSEKYQSSYNSLKNHLALCGDYNAI